MLILLNIFGLNIEFGIFLGIVGILVTALYGIGALIQGSLAWIFPRRAKLEKSIEKTIEDTSKKVEDTSQKVNSIEERQKQTAEAVAAIGNKLGIPIYIDGLASAPTPVYDPFAKGLEFIKIYKWDEAIAEFKQALKEARATQLVALYNLIGFCYCSQGKLNFALLEYEKSFKLAHDFNDKFGCAANLGDQGIIFQIQGKFDLAIQYNSNALKLYREIENRQGEADILILFPFN